MLRCFLLISGLSRGVPQVAHGAGQLRSTYRIKFEFKFGSEGCLMFKFHFTFNRW